MRERDLHREPCLVEMLDDPVIQAMMMRDNVERAAILELIRTMRDRYEAQPLAA
jgi:hypothetical protein